MSALIPVLLAVGSSTRIWPLSRQFYPKKFATIYGKNSLFQQSAICLSYAININSAQHITVTNSEYRFIVSEQLCAVGIDPGPILIEPKSKNTALSVLAACLYALNQNHDSVILAAPSDHAIVNTEGEPVYVSQGARHRLSNEGEARAILIEVQIDSYFGEDDIIRYDDIYNRG